MKRFVPVFVSVLATSAALMLAACGHTASAGSASASPSPNPRGANAFRGGVSGQLVQINPQTLIITGPNGDTTLTYTSSTTVIKTSVAALADITVGSCIVATGRKDAAGAVTATAVRLSPATGSSCATALGGGAGGANPGAGFGGGAAGASPRPSFSPRPSGATNIAVAAGEVTAIIGTSVTVQTLAGANQTITIPSTATVTKTAVAALSDLQTGQCIRAMGQPDSSGNVAAMTLTITPAGPSGTCTTRSGGFGGFGGGGGGGFGGGGAPSSPAA